MFQIHNLLELVKKEQNIYNVAFNEIIRQVSYFKSIHLYAHLILIKNNM